MEELLLPSPIQELVLPVITEQKIRLFVKRDDLIHPEISGNKWRKLKQNVAEAKKLNKTALLTFGGAFSNHIAATAAVGKKAGIPTIGIIRGEEVNNPTLEKARANGMQLAFLSREKYKQKVDKPFLQEIKNRFGDVHVIPEGGCNELGVKGSADIVKEIDIDFDYICCDMGTGATFAGIANAIKPHQQAIGFSVLKGEDRLTLVVESFQNTKGKSNWSVNTDYHFGGFAKRSEELENFIVSFREETAIPLDPVYTGKLFYGVIDRLKKRHFKPDSKVVVVHTGGLQGIAGYNKRYGTNL